MEGFGWGLMAGIIACLCLWLFANVYDYLNAEDKERVESFRKYLEE